MRTLLACGADGGAQQSYWTEGKPGPWTFEAAK
jgi:hypothetical protein